MANAEAGAHAKQLADEQAALLRLATLVAEGAPPQEIFSAVSNEVAELFGSCGLVLRFEPDGLGIVSVGVSAGSDIPAGRRWEFEEGMASLEVHLTGSSARVDAFDWSSGSGPAAETAGRVGIVSSVSNPIHVQGRLWGAVTAFSTSDRLPGETEARLERFSRLVATAIANAESRDAVSGTRHALELVAAEQAALRRVATLVARDATPAEVFATVTREVAHVFSRVEAPLVATVIRFDPGPEGVLVGASRAYEREPVGSRWEPKDLYVSTRVLRTGRSARVDEVDLETAGGPDADVLRLRGFLYQVGCPVVVEGRLWGAMTLNSSEELPAETDESLEKFTELVATAIADAESRSARARLADEQDSLRRVATLVAGGAPPEDVFAAVAREVAEMFGVPAINMARIEDDGTVTTVGGLGDENPFRVGSRRDPAPGVVELIRQTGHPARIDAYSELPGAVAKAMVASGVRSSIGAPIFVDGRVWGALAALSTAPEPLPPGAEDRLAAFTELLATAVANAEAHDELRRFGDEQAALSRVATLVADGGLPEQVFEAVVDEVSNLLGLERIELVRYDDGAASGTVVAAAGDHPFPAGTTWSLDDPSVMAMVARTGRAARVDDYDSLTGAIAGAARSAGFQSAIGEPITVEGRLWGAIIAISTHSEPIPERSQERLAQFTGLIATAIANAESRAEVEQLANEQAALRRVATLVAAGATPAEVFGAAAEEAQRILDLPLVVLSRYEGDGTATVVAALGEHAFQPGTSWPLDGPSVSALVLATGRPAALDYTDAPGAIGRAARAGSLGSGLGVPIVVNGSVWGVMVTAFSDCHPLPPDTEARLADFTDLVATAISNADSRVAIGRLADEQAALRRVATLVAQGTAPMGLFAAVAVEVAAVVGVSSGSVSRFLPDGTSVVLASHNDPGFPVGSRWRPDEGTINAGILAAAGAARVDQKVLSGPIAEASRISDVRSAVAAPIVVEGSVWGMVAVGRQHSDEPLPPEAETRLAAFTELMATAIANAESRDELTLLADEQAALRRVATLVARDAPSTDVFEAVATEVGKLLDADVTIVGRYDGDGMATAIGNWSASGGGVPVGTRSAVGGRNVLTLVAETGKPARMEGYEDASGEAAEIARAYGWSSSIAAPIIVEDRTWGVMLVATEGPDPFPTGAEERLAAFTELIATAVANAQAQDELRRLVVEQGALSRVATLAADGGSPEQVFEAVVAEVSILLGLERIDLIRFDGDTIATVIAASGDHPFPVGTTWPRDGEGVMASVARTGRAVRIDDYDSLSGSHAADAREAGVRSAIGAPITVDGRLWGMVSATSTDPAAPIPEESQSRLAQFTELVATAIANAESRTEVERLAEEQAALRRVATFVAKEDLPTEVFAKVAEEASHVLGDLDCVLVRKESDGTATVVAVHGKSVSGLFPAGSPVPVDEAQGVVASVLVDGLPHRIDDYADVQNSVSEGARERQIRSAVGCPILARGEIWGAIAVASFGADPCRADAEQHLAQFADLVATAIANAEARAEIVRLADERGAQRRVATLVAHGAESSAIFSAISDEVSRLVGSEIVIVGRLEQDPPALVAVAAGKDVEGIEVGHRWRLEYPDAAPDAFRSRRAVRNDGNLGRRSRELAETLESLGVVSTIGTPIIVDGRLWGALMVSSRTELPASTEERLETFTDLAGTAIANAQARSELAASRRRIVTAFDDARRQIERNLHDGTQQRLVSLGLAVRAAEADLLAEQEELRDQLTRIAVGLADAVEDLQEISRGIHPAILSRGGLGAALRGLGLRSPIAVRIDLATDARLPEPIEVAAYFVASEALANAAKHSQATLIEVLLEQQDGSMVLEVRDNGVGGADPTRGSGLIGLTDRVEALGGSISIDSKRGEGTEIRVTLPVDLVAPRGRP